MIRTSVHSDLDDIERLIPEWNTLAGAGSSSVFTSPEWCVAAWRTFADLGRPCLITARDGDGLLLGLLPLTVRGNTLDWAGCYLGDEHDVRVHPRTDAKMIVEVLVHRATSLAVGPDNWLVDVRPDGLLAEAVGARVKRRGCPAPTLPVVPPDVEFDALACVPGWSRHRRRGLRGRVRGLARRGTVSVRWVDDPAQLGTCLLDFASVRLLAWEARGRLDELPVMDRHPRFPAFLKEAGERLAARGMCQLAQLLLDGRPVAQSLYFVTPTTRLLYMNTYGEDLARYSPSHLLLAAAAKRAVGEGIATIELGRGDEPYKFELGARPRHLTEIAISSTVGGPGLRVGVDVR